MGKTKKQLTTEAYTRLCNHFGTTNQGELARHLGCCASRVSQVLSGEKIPDSWLLFLLSNYRLNPDWVLNGAPHPKKLKPDV